MFTPAPEFTLPQPTPFWQTPLRHGSLRDKTNLECCPLVVKPRSEVKVLHSTFYPGGGTYTIHCKLPPEPTVDICNHLTVHGNIRLERIRDVSLQTYFELIGHSYSEHGFALYGDKKNPFVTDPSFRNCHRTVIKHMLYRWIPLQCWSFARQRWFEVAHPDHPYPWVLILFKDDFVLQPTLVNEFRAQPSLTKLEELLQQRNATLATFAECVYHLYETGATSPEGVPPDAVIPLVPASIDTTVATVSTPVPLPTNPYSMADLEMQPLSKLANFHFMPLVPSEDCFRRAKLYLAPLLGCKECAAGTSHPCTVSVEETKMFLNGTLYVIPVFKSMEGLFQPPLLLQHFRLNPYRAVWDLTLPMDWKWEEDLPYVQMCWQSRPFVQASDQKVFHKAVKTWFATVRHRGSRKNFFALGLEPFWLRLAPQQERFAVYNLTSTWYAIAVDKEPTVMMCGPVAMPIHHLLHAWRRCPPPDHIVSKYHTALPATEDRNLYAHWHKFTREVVMAQPTPYAKSTHHSAFWAWVLPPSIRMKVTYALMDDQWFFIRIAEFEAWWIALANQWRTDYAAYMAQHNLPAEGPIPKRLTTRELWKREWYAYPIQLTHGEAASALKLTPWVDQQLRKAIEWSWQFATPLEQIIIPTSTLYKQLHSENTFEPNTKTDTQSVFQHLYDVYTTFWYSHFRTVFYAHNLDQQRLLYLQPWQPDALALSANPKALKELVPVYTLARGTDIPWGSGHQAKPYPDSVRSLFNRVHVSWNAFVDAGGKLNKQLVHYFLQENMDMQQILHWPLRDQVVLLDLCTYLRNAHTCSEHTTRFVNRLTPLLPQISYRLAEYWTTQATVVAAAVATPEPSPKRMKRERM